ncbi:L-aspartate oxidase [Candidatus Schneideria nysicola]|uniref:L-aspartate oxidase n=1 Tax=Candidatus Schneideria nysicola TaxID=1081631 RepID=UPI001CAA4D54|nr:L-aspartate oxidase [Candidatus Schneideria nysicola]UAJ65393.1 L-aspartate oxidase [Candidatus Schneideria nysicola]
MKKECNSYITDVLIVGSGVAGLSIALQLSENFKIVILSKTSLEECSTLYAQGGIATVLDENDSTDSHIHDTLIAGRELSDKNIVEYIATNAWNCIQWLIDQGMIFDYEISSNHSSKKYHLTREGGHSHRRILHVADSTGRTLENLLINKILKYKNIQTMEYRNVIDLIFSDVVEVSRIPPRIIGAYVWNSIKKEVEIYYAKIVVLATGGASRVYKYTTNPNVSSGDGIAIAWRAGCRVANLEFIQFHPTCLFHPKVHNFLLTEALRGEGAYLCRPDGSRFMSLFDKREELAPRDIVTRAINYEMKRLKVDCMYLNISHQSDLFIRYHFPTIYNKLLKLGIDLTREPIPITPAAHYTCGGVVVDRRGRTDLDGLYAIGEVSYTGLHGANRLASNSLIECLVYGYSAAKDINECLSYISPVSKCKISIQNRRIISEKKEKFLMKKLYDLRSLMWKYVGIMRSSNELKFALNQVKDLQNIIFNQYEERLLISDILLELRNLIQVAQLIIVSALSRKESRGLHFMTDFPDMLSNAQPTFLNPNEK